MNFTFSFRIKSEKEEIVFTADGLIVCGAYHECRKVHQLALPCVPPRARIKQFSLKGAGAKGHFPKEGTRSGALGLRASLPSDNTPGWIDFLLLEQFYPGYYLPSFTLLLGPRLVLRRFSFASLHLLYRCDPHHPACSPSFASIFPGGSRRVKTIIV